MIQVHYSPKVYENISNEIFIKVVCVLMLWKIVKYTNQTILVNVY